MHTQSRRICPPDACSEQASTNEQASTKPPCNYVIWDRLGERWTGWSLVWQDRWSHKVIKFSHGDLASAIALYAAQINDAWLRKERLPFGLACARLHYFLDGRPRFRFSEVVAGACGVLAPRSLAPRCLSHQLSIFLIDLFVGTYRLSSHARLEVFVI